MIWKKKIFLSHRASDPNDRQSAYRIKDILEELAPEAVGVFVSDKDIPAGDQWRSKLAQELKEARYLIFLYTDRQANWDWCHFEAGWFLSSLPAESADSPGRPIVVLHPESIDLANSPLQPYQTIPLPRHTPRLEQFLVDLSVEEDPLRKLWLQANPGRLRTMAEQIEAEVKRMEIRSTRWSRSITLRGAEAPDLSEVPRSYRVEIDEGSLQELFDLRGPGRDGKAWTWEDLMSDSLRQQAWVAELAKSMAACILDGKRPQPISGNFRTSRGGTYHPVLHRIGRSDLGYSFEVLFLEDTDEDRTDSVSSFADLIERLIDLLDYTDRGDPIRFLAYTPALGFLTETEARWVRLRQAVMAKARQIDLICLNENELRRWHREFAGKKTARGKTESETPTITDSLIEAADEASMMVLSALREAGRPPTQKAFGEMPGFYLFKNTKRAIIVAPVGVPLLTDRDDVLANRTAVEAKVEMFGLDTTVGSIIENADLAFTRFNTR
jgi:hypothetical protein